VTDLVVWILGIFAVAAAGGTIWYLFREQPQSSNTNELYQHALEKWLDGELAEATTLLTQVVQTNPTAMEPFLQLGNLLRLQGDPARAAVLHRGLTVRQNLSKGEKVLIGLALAEDLIDLEEWGDAGAVLDSLVRHASQQTRYWRARFRQFHGQDKRPDAARALKRGAKTVPEKDRPWFLEAYASYQLDRAFEHVRLGETTLAGPRIKDVEKMGLAPTRTTLVKAMLAAATQDPATALTLAAEGLLDSPEELAVFLPVLQEVLLQSGQYPRTIPILERACQSENSPPSLWIDLALLYEKIGDREKALRFLESKAGRGKFTPNAAAPYLRMLAGDAPVSDFSEVWSMLNMPAPARGWSCHSCGRLENSIRWFCPGCSGFHTFHPSQPSEEGNS